MSCELSLPPHSTIVIVGGAGCLGSRIARVFAEAGHEVRRVDAVNETSDPAIARIDVRDAAALQEILVGADAVVNVARVGSPAYSDRTVNSVMIDGAHSLTKAAEEAGVSRMVFVSSFLVYGAPHPEAGQREDAHLAPESIEGQAFAQAERIYQQWAGAQDSNRRLLILRPAEHFGPGAHTELQQRINQLARFTRVRAAIAADPQPIVSSGTIARAILTLLTSDRAVLAGHRIYNVADTARISAKELARLVETAVGSAPAAITLPLPRVASRLPGAVTGLKQQGFLAGISGAVTRSHACAHPLLDTSRLREFFADFSDLPQEIRESVSKPRKGQARSGEPSERIRERWNPPAAIADTDHKRVVAVVVTYNREHLIGECLDALQQQTRPVDRVVVVDNASTDESGLIADQHSSRPVVWHLHRNVGGAGGFTAGIAYAMLHESPDFLWLMDDDTIPRPDALEALVRVESQLDVHASVLSSRAVWVDGRDHPMNSSRTRLGTTESEIKHYEALGARPIRTASFVSAFINAGDVWKHGLPHADYFIWSDDFEYTGRLLKHSHGFSVPESVVEHRTVKFSNAQTNPGGRFYYDVRNRVWALAKTKSFTPIEVVLFGGKSILAWLRTLAKTKGDLLPIATKAARDAILSRPRRSDAVLHADPEVASYIRSLEKNVGQATQHRKLEL